MTPREIGSGFIRTCVTSDAANPQSRPDSQHMGRAIDDPAWVLARYLEAKELLDEVWCESAVPIELRVRAEDFHHATLMDSCTTLGPDCACNTPTALTGEQR